MNTGLAAAFIEVARMDAEMERQRLIHAQTTERARAANVLHQILLNNVNKQILKS